MSSVLRLDAVLWIGSVEYALDKLSVAAEYSRWHVDSESADTMLAPKHRTTSERLYGMFAYRVTTWFRPGAYYSLYFPDIDRRNTRDSVSHDTAITFRFDINDHWLCKLEPHFIWGTASLDPVLNGNRPKSSLARDMWLFMAKTTAYF